MDFLLTIAGKLGLALVLIAFNGFFVAAELALVKVREAQLDALVTRGRRAAKVARALKANINSAISATQLGITLASLALGRFVEPLVETAARPVLEHLGLGNIHWLVEAVSWTGFLGMTFVLILVGEMVPKALAIQKTEAVALGVALPLRWFLRVAHPLIWLIDTSARTLLARFGIDSLEAEGSHSEEELRLLFLATRRESPGTDLGREIVLNALDLRRRVASDVMRPRRELTALSTAMTMAECLAVAEQSRYSRFPLCVEGNLDRTLGVVHVKDLYALRHQAKTGAELRSVARPLIFVPESARLERLLQFFLDRKLHLALVVDEYGGTTGLVTLENVVEAVIGQIQDEFDQEKPQLVQRSETEWELDGALPLFELEELTGENLDTPDVTTVSGWLTSRLGGFPKRGNRVKVGRFELLVEELDGLRVSRLSLRATDN
ncbi:MAG TPA: hemolysin family protein, partial [Candidatus Limnocylindria bacterium]|nr:hemolysin family protein [Candidatus Limnocylindria bacterium]